MWSILQQSQHTTDIIYHIGLTIYLSSAECSHTRVRCEPFITFLYTIGFRDNVKLRLSRRLLDMGTVSLHYHTMTVLLI